MVHRGPAVHAVARHAVAHHAVAHHAVAHHAPLAPGHLDLNERVFGHGGGELRVSRNNGGLGARPEADKAGGEHQG